MNLTPKQLRLVTLIRDHRVTHGYSPTMQELADELGVSKVTVFEHVEALIKKEVLERQPNKARSLSIVDDTVLPDEESSLCFPLVGKIAAGYPVEKFPQTDELDVAAVLGSNIGQRAGSFALRVDGDSMRDEGILDGDYVIVERRSTARNGERVVALLASGETTLKTYFLEADHIRLQPANPDFEPIIVKECVIQGIVTAVMRRY